jgi:hypothetical protein
MKTSEIRSAVESHIAEGNNVTRNFVRLLSKKLVAHCEKEADEIGVPWYTYLYRVLYNTYPKCPVCESQKLSWKGWTVGLSVYCSSKCAGADPEVNERRKATCVTKYGVDSPQKVPTIRAKFKRSMKRNYGVTYTAQSPTLKRQMEATLQERYGVTTPYKSPEVQKKIRATMKARYGVEHTMQNRDLHERQQKSGFKIRTVRIKGKTFRVRGYEPEAIRWLVKHGCDPKLILTTAAEGVPSVPYIDADGTPRVYHPDFKVKLKNRWGLIEVKSTFTSGLVNDKRGTFSRVKAKAQACVVAGYRFKLLLVLTDGRCCVIKDIQDKTRKQVISEVQCLLPAANL